MKQRWPICLFALGFEAFVFFFASAECCNSHNSCSALNGLSPQITCLVFIETRPTSKRSVAWFARDSNIGEDTRRDRHTFLTWLFIFVSYITTTSFNAAFTDIPFRNFLPLQLWLRDSDVLVLIQEIDSFFGFDMPVKDNILAIQTSIDEDSIIFVMLFE